jgi:hypothetical protein
MEKFFNTAGPIKPNWHYHIPLLERLDWPEVQHLIANGKYFVLHAPRQTGKTSTLLAMMEALNHQGEYAALYANIEGAQAARGNSVQGIDAICSAIANAIRLYLKNQHIFDWLNSIGKEQATQDKLRQLLTYWAEQTDKPTVLFLDEVDALVGDTLISLLRQIRAGYAQRPEAFPQSVVLCGVRDVRDYRIQSSNSEIITGGSAFNIKAKSLRMGHFDPTEVRQLLLKHTQATGQVFEDAIFPELWEDTHGQPWLVNALAYEMTWEDREARDRTVRLTPERYQAARERLIQSRATHLDQLTDKLKEPRVHRVIAAILQSEDAELNASSDDLQYCEDLGLIATRPQLRIANRIYQEVIPRELTWPKQVVICHEQAWYLDAERRLDFPKLLTAFQQFFREHADIWLRGFDYKEAGPQLLLQAFLQRIINGGGRIHREYALGRKRTDLFIEWPLDETQGFYGPVQRIVIELKLLRKSLEQTIQDGLQQTADYADRVNAEAAYLLIFDRTPNQDWDNKIWRQTHTLNTRSIQVWGC